MRRGETAGLGMGAEFGERATIRPDVADDERGIA
jgi:hypothetical protein